MEVLTEHGLVAEVAVGTFSFKNKISAGSIKLLWEKLSRFVNGGRCTVIQPNYGLLATASAVHRGTCQRLLLELMQRLGSHILSGRTISVAFPGVGRLFTNKAGRIQFDFDPLLREFFELERERVIPEMPAYSAGDGGQLEEEHVGQLVKGLQQVHLHNPPAVRSRPATGATPPAPTSPSSRAKRLAHAPYKGALLDLWRLCKSSDRINSGCVPRLDLEQWLYRECAGVLRQVAAATILELLSINTYGKTGKHILYKPFLDQLEAAIGNVTPVEVSPRSMQSPRRLVEVHVESPRGALRRGQLDQEDMEEEGGEVAEVTLSPADQEHQHQPYAWPGQPQYAQQSHFPPPPLALPQTPQMVAQAWQGPAQQAGSAETGMPHHYYQNHLSPRSRADYDQFNRVHFEKLEQARGRDYKRAVTPKVGEDELNRREHQAIRHAGDAVTPAQVLGLRQETPYSRDTPQIREKERILEGIAVAESQWPYVPTRQPTDKRPSSAVNRPQSRGRTPGLP
ncbi:hypothetical protein GPECTOR_1g367 [Gonium pectorale]|uniref:CCDC81 HU domain-containing protein n=1 Tax=Gonium pectorale TaxID=33097 RepID=A0A150H345_GONPE|nr:hypothetical protein GPECTOR_1g367 [Gonium pectorale]|eukprot:KXZ56412.1 hypothetical protein GPECTOR_1g367 [Gonium pectorale]